MHDQIIPSRLFTIYDNTDLTGTAAGNPQRYNYCSLPTTANSRYRLNRADHNQIFQFKLTAAGTTQLAFCLDKFKDGPYGDIPYRSQAFETIFPQETKRQKQMLGWIIANTFPAVSAAETFALAGVDSTEAPVLDDNDAYAAVQVALWVLLGQIAPSEAVFINCADDTLNPKSDRLNKTVLKLLALAGDFADIAVLPPALTAGSNKTFCNTEDLSCCNESTIPVNPAEPWIAFRDCPTEVRTVCGRLLVGPFFLKSNMTGTPAITVEPFCDCKDAFTASFMDFCGNPISSPGVGQEFYIALRKINKAMCFRVKAGISGTITRVITMEPTAETTLNYQPIGGSLEDYEVSVNTSLCVCVTEPDKDSKCLTCQSGIHIDTSNHVFNSTNNNNDSTSTITGSNNNDSTNNNDNNSTNSNRNDNDNTSNNSNHNDSTGNNYNSNNSNFYNTVIGNGSGSFPPWGCYPWGMMSLGWCPPPVWPPQTPWSSWPPCPPEPPWQQEPPCPPWPPCPSCSQKPPCCKCRLKN